jgi:uncharacterized protein (TIGR04255 family)
MLARTTRKPSVISPTTHQAKMAELKNLPRSLSAPPLVDAIFEVRYDAAVSGVALLPGILLVNLKGAGQVEQLGAMQMPKEMRDLEPTLHYAPLLRLAWENTFIQIGDKSLTVSSRLPYPGWIKFKAAIEEVLSLFCQVPHISAINRYSMKYVNLLHDDEVPPAEKFDWNVSVGETATAHSAALSAVRMDIPQDDFLLVLQIATSATANLPDRGLVRGALIDVDVLSEGYSADCSTFVKDLSDNLERVHEKCKSAFFSSIKKQTLEKLGPIYEQ